MKEKFNKDKVIEIMLNYMTDCPENENGEEIECLFKASSLFSFKNDCQKCWLNFFIKESKKEK